MSFLLRLGRLLPPKSPILGNFETKGLGLKSPNLGDLGGFPNSSSERTASVELTLENQH